MEISVKQNALRELERLGQSVWIDFLRRGMITSGELAHMIEEDGVSGVTSNPSIFEKAIAGSHDYDEAVRELALAGRSVETMIRSLVIDDIRRCADTLRPVFDQSKGGDGYISLEVSPTLAYDSQRTIEEAKRYWIEVDRPNLMIKVPATHQGLAAIRALTSEGINVNVTLLFGLPRYRDVAEAFIAGLEDRLARGGPVDRIASVASFFLSRIDVLIDPMIEAVEGKTGTNGAASLVGTTAIACAKIAYSDFREIFGSERFKALAARGARPQRLLWASTSTKNPAYSDVKYVEALIGAETINTMPLETLHAFRDHGVAAPRLTDGVAEARQSLKKLADIGIDLQALTDRLEQDGVKKFVAAFDLLAESLRKKKADALNEPVDRLNRDLGAFQKAARAAVEQMQTNSVGVRLWRKDPSLWTNDDASAAEIGHSLGWLHVPEKMEESIDALVEFRSELKSAGFKHVVLMGMGGSSLAPIVFEKCFPTGAAGIPLTVIDTTDPITILAVERSIPIEQTFFIVASKSGTTAEPLALGEYFHEKVKARIGDRAGDRFAVITDPDTPLVRLAKERSYRRIFQNFPDIGGRYSAFSLFGLVPASLMGVDAAELLIRGLRMAHACSSCVPAAENPGLLLGSILGSLAGAGRDKATFLMPEGLSPLGMWLEQLLAESTGKNGTGILPVAGEPIGRPEAYGDDRLFIDIRLGDAADGEQDRKVSALRDAGHPVVGIALGDLLDIGQEFFRWEIATAAAGHLLHINAFDQPNVQESKENTNRLLGRYRSEGALPSQKPFLAEGAIRFFYNGSLPEGKDFLGRFLALARPHGYVAIMAYLPEQSETDRRLQSLRSLLRDRLHAATTVGYGPRFLHSTGQFHKGGPDTGVFIQLTADDAEDAPVPGQPFTFGVLKRAQALGDFHALNDHGRRVVSLDLGREIHAGLDLLQQMVEDALPPATQ